MILFLGVSDSEICFLSLFFWQFQLGVSKPIIDNEIITGNMMQMLQKNAHMPVMMGIAESEWNAKRRNTNDF